MARVKSSIRLNASYTRAIERAVDLTGIKASEYQIKALASWKRQQAIGMGKHFLRNNKRIGQSAQKLYERLNKSQKGIVNEFVKQEKYKHFVQTAKTLIHSETMIAHFTLHEILDNPNVLQDYPWLADKFRQELEKVGISKSDIRTFFAMLEKRNLKKESELEAKEVAKKQEEWERKILEGYTNEGEDFED